MQPCEGYPGNLGGGAHICTVLACRLEFFDDFHERSHCLEAAGPCGEVSAIVLLFLRIPVVFFNDGAHLAKNFGSGGIGLGLLQRALKACEAGFDLRAVGITP